MSARATAVALLLALPSWAEYPTGRQQMRLDTGMTIEQVVAVLGEPDDVEQMTCGSKTKEPWVCRSLVYRETDGYRRFDVVFQRVQGAWLVNGWR